jgi:hypothetical protein
MDYGLRVYTIRGAGSGKSYLRITNFIMPNLSAFGGSTVGEGYAVHWHVPINDTCHWKYVFMFSREKALSEELRKKHRADITPDYRLIREESNRYQQDRDSMRAKTFTGMGFNFQAHDAFATESQGRIQDRTAEHLDSSDKAIIASRKLLLNGIEDVKQGREPRHRISDPKMNRFPHLVVISEVVPDSIHWKDYAKLLVDEGQAVS